MGPRQMRYCSRCLYPAVSANLILDDEGVCSACRLQEEFDALTPEFWERRQRTFQELVAWARGRAAGGYDCVVPVSGGKDSYFQTETALQQGLRPLLVTYHGNNYLPEGQRNLDRMRQVFDVDHLVFGPGVGTLVKLNRRCFRVMGDMNWHAHAGIKIYPMHVAVRFGVPLVLWGEITWSVSGMFSADDFVEYNKRTVFEHDLRGYTAEDMLGGEEGLTAKDLAWLTMPSDREFEQSGTRGVYVGNFFPWDPNRHAERMRERYGFEFAAEPFERTYRRMSNLDDMHENGVHDYLKFVKFGYGRATDHASKDIRAGYLTRGRGAELVRQLDHVKPRRDLARWLAYVGMSEEEFDRTADAFRDPRVWWIRDGRWWKQTLDGEPAPYGEVSLDPSLRDRYRER